MPLKPAASSLFDISSNMVEGANSLRSLIAEGASRWARLNECERKRVLETLVEELTHQLDVRRGVPGLCIINFALSLDWRVLDLKKFPSLSRIVGYYDFDSHIIYVKNSILGDWNSVSRTVAHEMRHAYQYDIVRVRKTGIPDDELAEWGRELSRPAHPLVNLYLHSRMSIELDAKRFEEEFVKEFFG